MPQRAKCPSPWNRSPAGPFCSLEDDTQNGRWLASARGLSKDMDDRRVQVQRRLQATAGLLVLGMSPRRSSRHLHLNCRPTRGALRLARSRLDWTGPLLPQDPHPSMHPPSPKNCSCCPLLFFFVCVGWRRREGPGGGGGQDVRCRCCRRRCCCWRAAAATAYALLVLLPARMAPQGAGHSDLLSAGWCLLGSEGAVVM